MTTKHKPATPLPKSGRCDYCQKPSIKGFAYYGFLDSPRFGIQRPVLTVRACAEHVGCPNWNGMLKFHPAHIHDFGDAS